MNFKFNRPRSDKISKERIIQELENAAKAFNYVTFGHRDFDKVASIKHKTVIRTFGSWNKAIDSLKELLKDQGLELLPGKRGYFSEKELFGEMERIWVLNGHRPSKDEWFGSSPKYSYATYRRYFNGWTNACLKFIEHKMGTNVLIDNENAKTTNQSEHDDSYNENLLKLKPEDSRTIPLGLRLKVLDKDNFRCVFCGRSPATDIGVQLHIDHIVPFSKGGKSLLENLQTLCLECNLGKSNKSL